MKSATPTASPEALAATAALLSGGAKFRRSALSEAFDSFAAPVWKRVEAAEKRANAAERLASVAKDTMTELRKVRKRLTAETKRANDAKVAEAKLSDLLREAKRKTPKERDPAVAVVGWPPFKRGPLPTCPIPNMPNQVF